MGNTIGADADEKIRVVFAGSRCGAGDRVMRLEYEQNPRKNMGNNAKWKFR